MNAKTNSRHGGRILADQLSIQGCHKVFCVPGESFLAALDGLHDQPGIETIVCRHEGGAAMMAEAYGKLTGTPGVCFVTRGPGATNASAGVHIAQQDSTPMILFIGQVERDAMDREAFQEIDYRRMYGQLAKWVAQIEDPARIPEYVSRAYHTATSGRPGPVVLALPEDMLSAHAEAVDARPAVAVQAKAAPEDIRAFESLLSSAERPLMILGGGGWSQDASTNLQKFAQANRLPVCVSFRCQDYFDNRHDCYCGHAGVAIDPKLARRIRECDLLINVGARLGEMTTAGFSLVDIPNPQMRLVHVYPGAEELGRIYRPDLAINASAPSFAAAIADVELGEASAWEAWTQSAVADYRQSLKPIETPGELKLEQVVTHLRERLDRDAIVCNGAGNYGVWVHRYYQYGGYGTQLAPTAGSMGYGFPAAISAKMLRPECAVVCFAGDGCFLMNSQEMATAVNYGANVIVVVVNNGMLGTIRMHQERRYPARPYATDLYNPDFAALARAYGAHGVRVSETREFIDAFDECLSLSKPALIEALVDPEALTPMQTLSGAREQSSIQK